MVLKEGELQCLLDERSNCVHIGSLPELHNNEEVKVPPHSAYGEIT